MQGKYLITTDNWFYAPNGLKYRSVWGDVKIVEDSLLGIKTNRNSSNWYAYVGNEENGMIVAGCQIHYAIRCDESPNTDYVIELNYDAGKSNEIRRPSEIYIAQ